MQPGLLHTDTNEKNNDDKCYAKDEDEDDCLGPPVAVSSITKKYKDFCYSEAVTIHCVSSSFTLY